MKTLVDRGTPLEMIKALNGGSSIDRIGRYLSTEELANVVDRFTKHQNRKNN